MQVPKIVITGPGAVGKTATCIMYTERVKKPNYRVTLGANFYFKKDTKFDVALQIWDLAGQSAFGIVRTKFYTGSAAIVLMIDLSNKNSYQSAQDLLELELFPYLKSNHVPCVFIVGNKIDLPTVIDDSLLNELALQIYEKTKINTPIFKISAFDIKKVDELFDNIIKCILENELVN